MAASSEIRSGSTQKHYKVVVEKKEEAAPPLKMQYSEGTSLLDGIWNLGVWGAETLLSRKEEDPIEVFHGAMGGSSASSAEKKVELSVAQKMALPLSHGFQMKCEREGEMFTALEPYFNEGEDFAWVPGTCGTTFSEWALVMERMKQGTILPADKPFIGKYRDLAENYVDNRLSRILPLMGNEEVSFERKVVELDLLLKLEDTDENSSTRIEGFLACFDMLSVENQATLLGVHFADAEDPRAALRECDVGFINGMLIPHLTSQGRLEAMIYCHGVAQGKSVKDLYSQLSGETQAKIAAFELQAQGESAVPMRHPSKPEVGVFTYFDTDPTGVIAGRALELMLAIPDDILPVEE